MPKIGNFVLSQISQVCQLCQQSPRLFSNHAAQLHTLLGLYCISVNCMDNAEAQFTTALRLTTHQELWAFIVTNLASVYIREGNRHQEVSWGLPKSCFSVEKIPGIWLFL
ncbi:MAU2 chromatid cohesion factor homolog, partial [Cyanistes caeruleus]|uniref:MAU2 chromatid cohesion factor homolog n=1 Tax=Cyanistes caeruleus TaxID=156563 RepID=UPI000CDA0385